MTYTDTSLNLISSKNPASTTETVLVTAHVISGATDVSSGTIDVSFNGSTLYSGLTLDSSGQVSFNISKKTIGEYDIQVNYSGITIYNPSQNILRQTFLYQPIVGLTGSNTNYTTYTATVKYEKNDFPIEIPEDISSNINIGIPLIIKINKGTYENINLLLSAFESTDGNDYPRPTMFINQDNRLQIQNYIPYYRNPSSSNDYNNILNGLRTYFRIQVPIDSMDSTFISDSFISYIDVSGDIQLHINNQSETKSLLNGSATFDVSFNSLSNTIQAVFPSQGPYIQGSSNILNVINIPLTISNKIYDGTLNALDSIVISDTFQSPDGVTVNLLSATLDSKDVGTRQVEVVFNLSGVNVNNYIIIPSKIENINIIPKDISANFEIETKTYDGILSANLSGTPTLNGIIEHDDVTIVITSEFNDINVGTDKLVTATFYKLSGTDANNYHIIEPLTSTGTIIPKDLSVTFGVYDKEYDDIVEVEVSGTPIVNGKTFDDDVSLIISSAVMTNPNVGVDKLVTATTYDLSGGTANNYRIINNPTTTVTIFPKNVYGSFEVADLIFNGSTGATITSTELVGVYSSDDVGLTGDVYFLDPFIGNNKEVKLFNPSLIGQQSVNYYLVDVSSTYADIKSNVSENMTIQSLFSNYIYGDTVQLKTIVTNNLGGTVSYYQIIDTVETPVPNGMNLPLENILSIPDLKYGTYQFISRYNQFTSGPINIHIDKRPIDVSCQILDKDYDGTSTAILQSVNGFINDIVSDSLNIHIQSVEFENSSAGINKSIIGTYYLTGSNIDSYIVRTPIARATIRQLDVSGTFIPASRIYNGTTVTTYNQNSVVFTGILNFDIGKVILNNGVANFNNPDVGTNKPVILSGQLAGEKGHNYRFIGAYGTATIGTAYLICSAKISNKPYDGTNIASVSSVLSKIRLSADRFADIPVTDVSNIVYEFNATFDNENVGMNKAVSISGRIRTKNYALFQVQVDGSGANIVKREIQGVVKSTKEYNGSVSVLSYTKELINVVTKDIDDIGFDVSGLKFSDPNVGTKPINIGSYEITGTRKSNYNLTVIGTGTITGRPVVGKFPYTTKTYDGTTEATLTSSPFLVQGTGYGEVYAKDINLLSIGYDSIQFIDENAGIDKQMIVSNVRLVDQTNNYFLASYEALGTINLKDISGSFYAADKIYDTSRTAIYDPTTIQLFGIYAFDVSHVSIFVRGVYFDTEDAGVNKIVSGGTEDIYLFGKQSINYRIASFESLATIYPKPVDLKYKIIDKYFDKTDKATVVDISYSGIYPSDISNVLIDISMAYFENALIGIEKLTYVDSFEVTGTKKDNYLFHPDENVRASILRPVTFIEPKITYEEVYFGTKYMRKFLAIGNTPFVYSVFEGRLPNGLQLIGNDVSGVIMETGLFNFIISASIPNVFEDRRVYTLRIKPLVMIRDNKIYPLDSILRPSGDTFDFLDPQLENYIQEASLYYNDSSIIFGNSIFDAGFQMSIEQPRGYRYVFSVVEEPKRFFENVDYMIIFKIFDSEGNLVPQLTNPLSVNIYLDNAQNKKIEIYLASNPQKIAGNGEYKQRLGSKYLYTCNLYRGDGALLIYLSKGSSDQLDDNLLTIFEHLNRVDRYLLSDYMITPQLYIENNFNSKLTEWKNFIENKFPSRLENKKLSEL